MDFNWWMAKSNKIVRSIKMDIYMNLTLFMWNNHLDWKSEGGRMEKKCMISSMKWKSMLRSDAWN